MRQIISLIGKTFPAPSLSGVLVLVLVFVLGWRLGHQDYQFQWQNYRPKVTIVGQPPPSSEVKLDFKLFWDTWDLVSRQYIDKKALDPVKMYYGAIQGMVAAIGDPYTVFLPPEAQKATKEELSGSFEGVGIQLGFNKDKRLVVIAPLAGTPAERAGVKAGELILKVDDKDVASLSLPEVVKMIRGPKGSTVMLTLLGEAGEKPHDVTLGRDTIVVKSVEFSSKTTSTKTPEKDGETEDEITKTTKSGKKVAYLKLSRFGEKTNKEWDEAVSQALSIGPLAVIVDMRNNPGGFLEGAVYIASEFLDSGAVVVQENYLGQRQTFSVQRVGKMLKLPMVVLINKGSASASEIVAGALQERKRAKVVGENSFGKGTIQTAEDLPSGTGIHITTARWLTPEGRWINGSGVVPDIKVLEEDKKEGEVDRVLEKALEILDQES